MATTQTYKCISSYAFIKSRPSLFASNLATLKKETLIEVISISGSWAYFKYNNKNAYILTMYIQKVQTVVTGSITIRYLDTDTKAEISSPVTNNNLTIKSYTYTAPSIANYTVVDPSSKSVTLTTSNPNQEIIFYYKENKVYGSITIKYVDKATNASIDGSKVYKDLELGTYSYDAIDILGYTISGDSTKSVTLTDNNPNQTVIFEYVVEEIIEPLDPSKQNEVPYISTYYIKPVVKPDEEVIIDYYITDYYHKEYVNEDYSEVFKVTVRIKGKDDIVVRNLKAGDHSVSLGTFPNLDGQEQKVSILCTDKYGRNSHELFNFFLVRNDIPIKEYIMTTNDLITYNISNTNNTTKLVSTREGLQKLLDDKQAQGYNRLRLLAGTYRIDHLAPIYIPTKFTLDMNGATLKLHEFAGDKALMMELNNTFDSHVINGTIEGDFYNHDYKNSPNNSEWVHGISIGGEAKYSSYENLTIKDITGYGTINGIKDSRDNKLGYTYLYPRSIGDTFKLGDIDRVTGLDIESLNRTTCDFRDISGYSDIGYVSVSVYLGYQGNPCGTWNLICHFYDENKNFIKSTDAYQYRRISVPSNAKFMRVTILNEAYPTNLSIQLFRLPTNCQFKNLKLDNCRAVGIAPQGMNNMLFESCELSNCGSAVTKCALDAEDGWDMMQDVTFRKLNFHDNPYNEFLTCAGHNFILDEMIMGEVYIWSRTKDLVIRNSNTKVAIIGHSDNIVRSGYCRFYNNKSWTVRGLENASVNNLILRDCKIGSVIKATCHNCNITTSLLENATAFNCRFIDTKGEINDNVHIYNSEFIATEGNKTLIKFNKIDGIKSFTSCTFIGATVLSGNNCNCGTFDNCKFDNFQLYLNKINDLGDLQFNNCDIVYYDNIYTGSVDRGFIILYANANIVFNNCNINCIPSANNDKLALLWIRGSVIGSKTIFDNCSILKTVGYVIDGYNDPSSFKPDVSYEVVFNNTPISDIQLISDKYKNYTYYKVTIIN